MSLSHQSTEHRTTDAQQHGTSHHAAACGIFTARAAHRQLHGAYRCWLYRTRSWDVSFDEWKAGRGEPVETPEN